MQYEEPEKERNKGTPSLQTVAYVQMLHRTAFSKRCFRTSLSYKMYAKHLDSSNLKCLGRWKLKLHRYSYEEEAVTTLHFETDHEWKSLAR